MRRRRSRTSSRTAPILSCPTAAPICANGMLQLSRSALAIDTVAPPPQLPPSALWRTEVLERQLAGSAGSGTRCRAVNLPLSMAAEATTSLNDGSRVVQVAGDGAVDQRIGRVGEQLLVGGDDRPCCCAMPATFGSKLGFDTMARMAPVFGFRATTAPGLVAERIPGRLLDLRVDRELDGGALRLVPVRMALTLSRNWSLAVPLRWSLRAPPPRSCPGSA